jgi:PAS domain S-box-containing protein
MRRADGEYRWLWMRAGPLRDAQGRIVNWYSTCTDIEDRKRAEEWARQADRERRVVTDTIPTLLWSTLPDGSSDFNNQRWLEYTGLSADQAAGWGYVDVIHPEDYERRTPQWRAAFAAGEPMQDEARLRRADGQYRWFLHRAVPLRDEDGKILKWVGTSTDIEDLKQAEGVLREQAGLLDLSHDTVFVRDMRDVITYWNRGAEALYGWSRDEAVGKISHQLTQTTFPAPLDEINQELLRTDRWEGELVHTKRDGTRVVVASRWSLQRDELGQPAAILETNNDVTERKRLDNELRRSQAYLIAGQELSHTGTFSRLVSGEAYWSEGTYRIYGLDPTGPAPNPQQFLQLCHPDDRDLLTQAWGIAYREARSFDMDFRIIWPDGAIRHLHAMAQPVIDDAGAVIEVIGAVMDVTDRKRAERALRRARERSLQTRFAAVLEERTRLARDIHDTLLQGFTGIALKLVAASNRVTGPPDSIAALRDLIVLAQQTLTDARRAVWDLRSPVLAGGEFPAALRAATEDCVRGTKLELEYDVGGPPRPVDPEVEAVVVRVAQEAITNVVKHADARTVRVRLSFETRRVRLSVIDDGQGFAVEADFQAYGGHWGLLGMRERASQIHGKLALRSSPGHGTEVVLLVPYVAGHRSPTASTGSSSAS